MNIPPAYQEEDERLFAQGHLNKTDRTGQPIDVGMRCQCRARDCYFVGANMGGGVVRCRRCGQARRVR